MCDDLQQDGRIIIAISLLLLVRSTLYELYEMQDQSGPEVASAQCYILQEML